MYLQPMTEADFAAYLALLIPDYAAEHVRAGNWSAEDAETKAAEQIRQILPEGTQTPGNLLYTLRVEGEPEPVGILWLNVTPHGAAARAFIYDIVVHAPYRRRGYATQALTAAEDKARALGATAIALHVFGHNHGARALYEKLGYSVTDLTMAKDL